MYTQTITPSQLSLTHLLSGSLFKPLRDPNLPELKFQQEKGILMIKGKSTSADSKRFYQAVEAKIKNYLSMNNKLTCFFMLEDLNASSLNGLNEIFSTLSKGQKSGQKIKINWFAKCHAEEVLDAGIDYADLYDLKMNILPL